MADSPNRLDYGKQQPSEHRYLAFSAFVSSIIFLTIEVYVHFGMYEGRDSRVWRFCAGNNWVFAFPTLVVAVASIVISKRRLLSLVALVILLIAWIWSEAPILFRAS